MALMTDHRVPSVRLGSLTGFVLAGGASRRMGQSKPGLLLDGETMLDRQIRLLRSVARRVVVVGGSPGYLDDFNAPLVPDALPGRGPLAGLYTALLESRTEFNLVLGCDLPFVNRCLLAFIAERAIAAGWDVTVPRSQDGRMQPLCAVYHRRILYAVRTCLQSGENRPRAFFPRVRWKVIAWRELADAGFRPSMFNNMNTPEDYEHARIRHEIAGRPRQLAMSMGLPSF